jgi:dipeptidase E
MKFYLSSYKFGKEKDQLIELAPTKRIAIIPNALDFRGADSERTRQSIENKIERLGSLGFEPEVIDLKDYFHNKDALHKLIDSIGSVFVLGGNVLILRQAMKLSGLDEILLGYKNNPNFLYAGYSAAGCVLAPSLKPYRFVDDATDHPYVGQHKTIWEGLGLVDFNFMPHWNSDHPESEKIGKVIDFCKRHDIDYRAVRDGDVLII